MSWVNSIRFSLKSLVDSSVNGQLCGGAPPGPRVQMSGFLSESLWPETQHDMSPPAQGFRCAFQMGFPGASGGWPWAARQQGNLPRSVREGCSCRPPLGRGEGIVLWRPLPGFGHGFSLSLPCDPVRGYWRPSRVSLPISKMGLTRIEPVCGVVGGINRATSHFSQCWARATV